MHPVNLKARVNSEAHKLPPQNLINKRVKMIGFPFGDSNRQAETLYVVDLELLETDDAMLMSANLSPLDGQSTLHMILRQTEANTTIFFVQDEQLKLSEGQKSSFSLSEFSFVPDQLKPSGFWNVLRIPTISWMVPDQLDRPWGSWFNFRHDDYSLIRVLNIDALNIRKIPIIGSFSMCYFERPTEQLDVLPQIIDIIADAPVGGGEVEIHTQRHLFSLFEEFGKDPSTLSPVQADYLSSGQGQYEASWSHSTYVDGWAIGLDSFPYKMESQYWWDAKRQRAAYTGLGQDFGNNTYDRRMESHLYSGKTINSDLEFDGDAWNFNTVSSTLEVIGLPKPDYIMAAGGQITGTIMKSPDFCALLEDRINVFRVSLPRSADVTSFFWLLFDGKSRGLVFMECEYAEQPQHALQLVDYETFRRNGFADFNLRDFNDPSKIVVTPQEAEEENSRNILSKCMLPVCIDEEV